MLRCLRLLALLAVASLAWAQESVAPNITLAGHILDPNGMMVMKATVQATDGLGRPKAQGDVDPDGNFRIVVPAGSVLSLVASAEGFESVATGLRQYNENTDNIEIHFGKLASASEVLTVTEHISEPAVDQRDSTIFEKTLFTRDDQIFQTLGAGLNLGQHAGGGKSLEVRRFGFNLDHGGTGGGIKVMQDGIMLNQVSGGHSHGYLGALKSLSPELVENVDLINGPFNAQYGDFSGLGVVNIQTRSEMPDVYTGRVQFGQFNTRRFFGAYSPTIEKWRGLVAMESSYTDGPYQRPLNYLRNNLSSVWQRSLSPTEMFTIRLIGNTNSSYAAGQLPLDQIEQGKLDRYGYIDPTEGNTSRTGTLASSYSKNFSNGGSFRVDGMVQRLLFDLFSNFTFYLEHPTGDGFLQHDSRLQQAGNVQYQKPHSWGNNFGTLFTGVNVLSNQINLKLAGRQGRAPTDLRTWAQTNITNTGFYGQENLILLNGYLRVDLGLRYDTFNFGVTDKLVLNPHTNRNGGAWQPKVNLAYTPSLTFPFTLYANYGRAVTSTNARALINSPDSPLIANTDFYEVGTSHNFGRYSFATDAFWIDRNLETLYVADNGTTEFTDASRSYGYEAKSSVQINRWLSWNGSITKVLNSFYRTDPRTYIDRAPHFVIYSALTVSDYRNWNGSLRMRSINHYRLNGEEPDSRGAVAPGYSLWDFSVSRTINKWLDLNFSADNLFNKFYYETLQLYTSRLLGQNPLERVHGTPGYPRTVMGGVTIKFGRKN